MAASRGKFNLIFSADLGVALKDSRNNLLIYPTKIVFKASPGAFKIAKLYLSPKKFTNLFKSLLKLTRSSDTFRSMKLLLVVILER